MATVSCTCKTTSIIRHPPDLCLLYAHGVEPSRAFDTDKQSFIDSSSLQATIRMNTVLRCCVITALDEYSDDDCADDYDEDDQTDQNRDFLL